MKKTAYGISDEYKVRLIAAAFKVARPKTVQLVMPEAPFNLMGELMPEPKAPPAPRYDPRQMKLFE